jgi:hypothetical protein
MPMSFINNINGEISPEQKINADYLMQESSSLSSGESNFVNGSQSSVFKQPGVSYGNDQPYSVPLNLLRQEAKNIITDLYKFLNDLENLLRQVNLDPTNNSNLEQAHSYVWDEINKKDHPFPKIEVEGYVGELKYPTPPFICFDQYLYAEGVQTRGYRKFIKEYDNLISNTTFGHIYDFREIIKYLINEANRINFSLGADFGDNYEDDSQQQVASYYLYWLKMAIHYKELFAKSITSTPTGLPETEVDKATKKQAAQFQAFFSIKVNSLTTLIDSQLDTLHKDLVTNCDVFYSKYLSPSLKFKTKVVSDFALDIRTTNMKTELPRLSEEAAIALLAAEGNFKSVLTDLLERRNNTSSKIDSLYQGIIERRKYTSYISQLSIKAITRRRIITNNTNENYAALLSSLYVDESHVNSLKSSHALLDDLNEDSHPQYLMKSGGSITGDINIENEAKIDGVKISSHSHNGVDGSARIRSIDIDYDSVRMDINLEQINSASREINITVDSFTPDILTGGVPVADVNISIDIPDEFKDKYDFEILYVEL